VRFAALGAFDGLHQGHMKVISSAGGNPGVVFFEPVPRQVFGGRSWNRRLTTPQERYELLRDKGISSIITLPFDRSTAGTPPEDFSRLLAGIGLFEGFVVGYDFRYGTKASGTPDTLREDLRRYGLELKVVDPETIDSVPVKSGRIRSLLAEGDLQEASKLLGRMYGATGVVSRGRGLGRELGFPTLNIRVPVSKLLPPAGSYAAFAGTGCTRRKAVAFTVPRRNLIEVHVPSMRGETYGSAESVQFVSFIREPESFVSNEELKRKIKSDLEISMEVLKEWQ
jgi:riboflavin kinase / FMN adenylyltransferase